VSRKGNRVPQNEEMNDRLEENTSEECRCNRVNDGIPLKQQTLFGVEK
jgi:hypothetical protein